MSLGLKKENEDGCRRGSFYPVEPLNSKRSSLGSLYSKTSKRSISLLESNSSVDSVEIDKMLMINREFDEIINSRLTAFLYFYNPIARSVQSPSEIEIINSIGSLVKEGGNNPESSVVLKDFAKEVLGLQRIHEAKLKELEKNKFELETLEAEENGMSTRLVDIERKISKMLIENEEKNVFCRCLAF